MLNKVIIQGNLTKAPNIKYIGSNNTPITESSIASNDNSPSGTTLFIDFVFWGDKAESFSKFFTIGNEVIITGKLKLETWNDQSGKSQRRYKIIGDSFEFTRGGTKPSNNYQQTSNNYQQANQQTNQQTGNNYQQTNQQTGNNYQQTNQQTSNNYQQANQQTNQQTGNNYQQTNQQTGNNYQQTNQQTSNNYQQANQQKNYQQTGNNYQQTDQQNNYQQTGNELNNVDYDDDEIPF